MRSYYCVQCRGIYLALSLLTSTFPSDVATSFGIIYSSDDALPSMSWYLNRNRRSDRETLLEMLHLISSKDPVDIIVEKSNRRIRWELRDFVGVLNLLCDGGRFVRTSNSLSTFNSLIYMLVDAPNLCKKKGLRTTKTRAEVERILFSTSSPATMAVCYTNCFICFVSLGSLIYPSSADTSFGGLWAASPHFH